ncbi:hypothetical protein QLX67_06065, partial [Balneolaceae bacterium ANBcel3]|nr:hypothetical protein [Balneolaceae bacterium ANBcel3]
MKKMFLVVFLVILPLEVSSSRERESNVEYRRIEPVSLEVNRVKILNNMGLQRPEDIQTSEPAGPSVTHNGLSKDILQRLAYIYRVHLLSLEAQINDDLVTAEEYITDGLLAIQNLLDEHPEVQSSRQFTELYRTVLTEYQEFYGITESVLDVNGEIFTIREEL